TTGVNESLLKVSNASNKVPVQKLKDWNGLSNDNIGAGKKIIIGFLVSKEMAAVAANNRVKQQPPRLEEKPVVKTEPKKEIKFVAIEEKPTAKPVAAEDKSLVKAEPVKESAQEVRQENKKTEPVFTKEDMVVPGGAEEGYFKRSFDQQVKANPASKNTTVTSGIFKTTSGWQDAKYYLLIDNVATGTIVKIINPENNKTVYAKVLGEMNGIRQNQGLNIRISNAASTALGVADTEKFILKLNY
ncbi:MAG: LysM peptidoglycan-binding domain-containing protein, partial [Chitinophagaceae bacterium]